MRILIFLALTSSAFAGFSSQRQDDDFVLFFRGIQVFKHTEEFPMLQLANGTFDAIDSQGNFEIDNQVTNMQTFIPEDLGHMEDESLLVRFTQSTDQRRFVTLRFAPNGEISIDFGQTNLQGSGFSRWFLRFVASEEEYIWGGGEQYSYFNLRQGEYYPIWIREQGVGRNKSSYLTQVMDLVAGAGGDYHTSYWPQPSFLSSRGYHMELTFPGYSELMLLPIGANSEIGHTLYWHYTLDEEFPCTRCKIVLNSEATLMKTVQKINPGQPELPEWVYNGAIIGVQGGTDRMLEVLNKAKENDVAVSGMWIQDWSGKITTEFGTRVFWNWKWNSTWYPKLDEVIKELKDEQDVRVLAYITPHLHNEGNIFVDHESEENLWLKNRDSNGILSQDFGEFNVSTVDIITQDPECNCINTARIWYKDLIKTNLIDLGISGWMADFGEYTPMNAKTGFEGRWWNEEYNEILHGLLPQNWASLNREAVEETGKLGDIMYWMRAGGIESKYHQVMSWAGDQTVDWTKSDGLPSSIVAALSLAVSGMGLSHSDIGGYTSIPQLGDIAIRDTELLLRWAEYSVFTPVMRTHETNRPLDNAQVYDDDETLQKFGRLTRIYKTLKPYIKKAVERNAKEGIPVMRPLFLQYQSDEEAFRQDYQYMFGDDLLVAPVLEPGVENWNVYLPGPDNWVWLWDQFGTSDLIPGNQWISVYAPMGYPPVFYRYESEFNDLFKSIATEFGGNVK